MGNCYGQLQLRERIEIDLLRKAGHSRREIATRLGRSASTVSRELQRNAKVTKQWRSGYDPERAHSLALRRRRWDPRFKLARQPALRRLVRNRLAMGWSPEQIAGRLAQQDASMRISHESIYRFVYHRSAQKDYWHKLLPQAKHRRGRLRRGGISSVKSIKHRVSVHERPAIAETRKQPGHWEADLMLFSRYGQATLVLHEKMSRFTTVMLQPTKQAQAVLEQLKNQLCKLPEQLRKTITFDNGTEFALHYKLGSKPSLKTFFCDPHAPWQKGGVENAIGRLRRLLPRKTDLSKITETDMIAFTNRYNNTPRKCLNFKTPREVFTILINRVALQT